MPFHYWISHVAAGASYMDALHHDCALTLTDLSCATESEFPERYQLAIHKVERIFRTEERWMEEIGFPELAQHRAQHAGILGALYQGQARVMAEDIRYGRNMIDTLLPNWLLCHASTMDCVLADKLKHSAKACVRLTNRT